MAQIAEGGVEEKEPGEPDLAELAAMRAEVRVALDVLMRVDSKLRFRAETGRRVVRPRRYEELADALSEGTRVVAGTSDELGKILNEKIHELNWELGHEE